MPETRQEIILRLLTFSQRQIDDSIRARGFAEERVQRCNPYDAKYYRKEIDRCNLRFAHFEPEVEALSWAIEELFGSVGEHRLSRLRSAAAALRHSYANLVNGTVDDPVAFAEGLISPALSRIEDTISMLEQK